MLTIVSKEGVKKVIEIYLKGRNITNSLTPYEYSGLRNFISKNTRDSDTEKISNERLIEALGSLNIKVVENERNNL